MSYKPAKSQIRPAIWKEFEDSFLGNYDNAVQAAYHAGVKHRKMKIFADSCGIRLQIIAVDSMLLIRDECYRAQIDENQRISLGLVSQNIKSTHALFYAPCHLSFSKLDNFFFGGVLSKGCPTNAKEGRYYFADWEIYPNKIEILEHIVDEKGEVLWEAAGGRGYLFEKK